MFTNIIYLQCCVLNIKHQKLLMNGNLVQMLCCLQEHPFLLLYWSNIQALPHLRSYLGWQSGGLQCDCHPQVVGSNPRGRNSKLVAISTMLSLHKFLSQWQCAALKHSLVKVLYMQMQWSLLPLLCKMKYKFGLKRLFFFTPCLFEYRPYIKANI